MYKLRHIEEKSIDFKGQNNINNILGKNYNRKENFW